MYIVEWIKVFLFDKLFEKDKPKETQEVKDEQGCWRDTVNQVSAPLQSGKSKTDGFSGQTDVKQNTMIFSSFIQLRFKVSNATMCVMSKV